MLDVNQYYSIDSDEWLANGKSRGMGNLRKWNSYLLFDVVAYKKEIVANLEKSFASNKSFVDFIIYSL